ncbi:hypothetical protein D3C80_1869150 [compost metagenome]
MEDGVDEGDRIALTIDNAEIDRVLVFRLIPENRWQGAFHVDTGAQCGDHLVGEQFLGNARAVIGIGDQSITVMIGNLGCFRMQMDAISIGH